ncbi:MAG: hypothetical protein KGL44_11645, partial [Sphingomonadales bacterium]|nr:hypothetical protein [Sphingomonadales bacterium]
TNSKYDLAEYASNLINNTDIPYENSAIPPIPNELNDHDPLKLSLEMEKIEDFNLKDSIPEGLFTKLFRK